MFAGKGRDNVVVCDRGWGNGEGGRRTERSVGKGRQMRVSRIELGGCGRVELDATLIELYEEAWKGMVRRQLPGILNTRTGAEPEGAGYSRYKVCTSLTANDRPQ